MELAQGPEEHTGTGQAAAVLAPGAPLSLPPPSERGSSGSVPPSPPGSAPLLKEQPAATRKSVMGASGEEEIIDGRL